MDSITHQLFTIGHSTHSLDQFLALLAQHGIKVLADVRRFPGSRKFPHFNQESLAVALREAGVEYRWIEGLGGRRRKQTNASSRNHGLRNESFRNYADYMRTAEFQEGIAQLLSAAERLPTACMCSEGLFWRCHRRLISDFLQTKDIAVQHIMPSGELRPHTLTTGARIEAGELSYPPPESEQTKPLFE